MRWSPGSSRCFPLRRFYCFLAIPRAGSFLGIFDRLTIPGAFARPYRVCFVFPSASTPPNISPSPRRFLALVVLEQGSLGPAFFFGSQGSPTFSKLCFNEAYAVRLPRSPSPYSSTALSWVLAKVRRAFFGERLRVLGSSDSFTSPHEVIMGVFPSSFIAQASF